MVAVVVVSRPPAMIAAVVAIAVVVVPTVVAIVVVAMPVVVATMVVAVIVPVMAGRMASPVPVVVGMDADSMAVPGSGVDDVGPRHVRVVDLDRPVAVAVEVGAQERARGVVVVVAPAHVAAVGTADTRHDERTVDAVVAHRVVIVHADVKAQTADAEATAGVERDPRLCRSCRDG